MTELSSTAPAKLDENGNIISWNYVDNYVEKKEKEKSHGCMQLEQICKGLVIFSILQILTCELILYFIN